jgi:amino acid adenylation domain-containing protein
MSDESRQLIHELFEQQTARDPGAIAVSCERRSLTYGELNRRANQLARYLRDRGVGPDQLVGVCVERGVEMVLALLAVLKSGGAYVPLDPNNPSERLGYMLRDAAPKLLLTQERLKHRLPNVAAHAIAVDGDWKAIAMKSTANLDSRALAVQPEHLAYVIYTSGSTGKPKGVMVEHRSLLNLVHWHCSAFGLTEHDRCSCVAALGFDAATWEIWPPLAVGASLVVASSQTASDPEKLIGWWARESLDISFLPTPLAELAMIRNISNPQLRTLLIGGDQLRHRPVSASFALINNYGPTESTVVATSGRIHEGDATLHIGRPISNTQIYILDSRRQPVAVADTGEIYIGGAGVARGYLNRPDLTMERFVADPFSLSPQARMYKTGDLGRWRADGTVEYLGRNDDQVKIRGYRIELGEIENQLARHAQVSEAVVLAREDIPGQKRLVAYTKPIRMGELDVESLRAHVKALLPEYMVPSAYVEIEAWPLTINGKLDRRALPSPNVEETANREYEPPEGETEVMLASIWRELLGADRVGRRSNFLELGGHSLLATQVTARIRTSLSLDVPIGALFECPVLTDFAARVDELWRSQVIEGIEGAEGDIETMLEKVMSMPESEVEALLRNFGAEVRQ